jgi:hypothetical protein
MVKMTGIGQLSTTAGFPVYYICVLIQRPYIFELIITDKARSIFCIRSVCKQCDSETICERNRLGCTIDKVIDSLSIRILLIVDNSDVQNCASSPTTTFGLIRRCLACPKAVLCVCVCVRVCVCVHEAYLIP